MPLVAGGEVPGAKPKSLSAEGCMIGNEQEKRPQTRGSACGRSLPTNQYIRLAIAVKRFLQRPT
jgi:hypothetical protein